MKLHQKNNEYYNAFKKCLAMSGTNLKQFCNDNGLKYDTTYARLKSKWIDAEFLLEVYLKAGHDGYISYNICLPFINSINHLSQSLIEKVTND